jgi:hypothetical protein
MIAALSTLGIIGICIVVVAIFYVINHAQPNRNYGRNSSRKTGL